MVKNENGISTTKRRWAENFFSHSGNPLLFACVLAIWISQCNTTESFRLIFDSLKSKHVKDKWSPDLLRCSLAIKINCRVARIVPKMASRKMWHASGGRECVREDNKINLAFVDYIIPSVPLWEAQQKENHRNWKSISLLKFSKWPWTFFSVPFEATYGPDSVKHSVLLMCYLMSTVFASKQAFLWNRGWW